MLWCVFFCMYVLSFKTSIHAFREQRIKPNNVNWSIFFVLKYTIKNVEIWHVLVLLLAVWKSFEIFIIIQRNADVNIFLVSLFKNVIVLCIRNAYAYNSVCILCTSEMCILILQHRAHVSTCIILHTYTYTANKYRDVRLARVTDSVIFQTVNTLPTE